jgi:acetyl esterase/lipase
VRIAAILAVFPLAGMGGSAPDPLRESHVEAIHRQRVEWMKIRVAAPLPGVYQDFRAVVAGQTTGDLAGAARAAGVKVLFAAQGSTQEPAQGPTEMRGLVLIATKPGDLPLPVAPEDPQFNTRRERKHLFSEFKQYPQEVFALAGAAGLGRHDELQFRTSSIHVLARELTAVSIGAALNTGRVYTAADWLCDPAGFFFAAENFLGLYDIGDHAPLVPGTHLRVNLPIEAKISIEQNGKTVVETTARQFNYAIKDTGDYRMRASLTIDGETWPWIEANPIHVEKSPYLMLPMGEMSPDVEVHKNIAYIDDGLDKHKLDLYLPTGKKNFPMMVFLHGGSWRSGDRSIYPLFGNRFAQAGIGVAVPSYRLMPKDAYPAQVLDAAAAFAWVHRHAADYGGDVSRIYLAGHSAGGHLAALVTLDPKYLAKYDLNSSAIRGVIALSGIYDVGGLADFQNADDDPSPIDHVRMGAPRFLLTYCQWDYFDLPKQARDFAAALKGKFVESRVVYVAGESHISEIISTLKPEDVTARAILDFIR